MTKIWKRKWLVLIAAVAIFLSIGAVAWAAENGATPETAAATGMPITAETPAMAGNGAGIAAAGTICAEDCDQDCEQSERLGAAFRKAMREKGEQWVERRAKLMDALRDDMTAEDQALYDQLVQKAKDQREALRQAREDLVDTMKQLRDLADKYLDDES